MGKQLVDLKLTSDLTDAKGNLTAGGLIRNSDATYVNTQGTLAYSRGTRKQLFQYSDPANLGQITYPVGVTVAPYSWPNGKMQNAVSVPNVAGGAVAYFAGDIVINTTYIVSFYVEMDDGSAPIVETDLWVIFDTSQISAVNCLAVLDVGNVYRVFGYITSSRTFTGAWSGVYKAETQSSKSFKCSGFQLEALPSGNVIGTDLMDQESLTARAEGYTLVVGAVYKIGTRTTLDFTTVGAANNTAGTYFICHTAANLGAGDVASTVNSPAKGSFHGTAMLAGSTELVTNGGMEVDANWTNYGSPTTNERSTEQKYLGTYSRKVVVDADYEGIYQKVSLTSGKLYKLTFYYYKTAGTSILAAIRRDSDDSLVNEIGGLNVATAWTLATLYFVAPATADFNVRFQDGGVHDTTFYVDQVSVRQVQTTWARYGTNTMEIDEAEGSGGALKVTGNGSSTDALRLYLSNDYGDLNASLVPGETYQVSFKAKVSTGGSVSFQIYPGGDPWSAFLTDEITSETFTQKTYYFKAISALSDYLFSGNLASGESIWIEDLTIKSVPNLAYLSPGVYTATAGETKTIPAEPRFEANGLAIDPEATNFIIYSCDMTSTSVWVGANVGRSRTGAGPDGSRLGTQLTANAGNATILHTVADGGVAANKTYAVWLKRISGTGNIDLTDNNGTNWTTQTITSSWAKYALPTRSQATPIVGIRMVTSGDVIAAAFNSNIVAAWAGMSLPTDGCAITALTEAGSATNGYSWTMSTALKNSLGAASPSRGTMLATIQTPYAFDVKSDGWIGYISPQDAITGLAAGHTTVDNRIQSGEGANTALCDVTDGWLANTPLVVSTRWDSVANSGSGYMKVSVKKGVTWQHGDASNYDGAFDLGTSLRLAYGNEYPFWIRNIRFYDGWVADANLDAPWKGGLFPILPTFKKVKPYTY